MTHALIYARVASGTENSAAEALRVQAEACRRYGEAKGYEIVDAFNDHGSGNDPRRAGLRRLLEAANGLKGRQAVIIVVDESRLARSTEVAWAVEKFLTRVGARVEVAHA